MNIRLRPIEVADLPALFEQQCDPESNRMAAVKPRDETSFYRHWRTILADPTIIAHAILVDDAIVGSASVFHAEGQDAVGYWIAREHWGRGIASRAVAILVAEAAMRPLNASVACENRASIRVLEKCGFRFVGARKSPEDDRYLACTEWLYRLE